MEHFHRDIPGWFTFPRLYRRAVENSPSDGTLVEVGSWMGKSVIYLAVEAVNSNTEQRIFAVDTWGDHVAVTTGETFDGEATYQSYLEHVTPVAHRIETLRMRSTDAAATFEDSSCDFVFIDASHEYRDVRGDLAAWYPKVRPGGVLAGHDYHWPGVSRAVRDFATANGLKRPRKTELCWVMEKGRESRTRRQRLSDLLYWPWDAAYLLAGRLRYRHLVRRRRN